MKKFVTRNVMAAASGPVEPDTVTELCLYIENDARLYQQMIVPTIKNMQRKIKSGKYNAAQAVKAWQYVADEGVRRYGKEFGDGGNSVAWVNKNTRIAIAEELMEYYDDSVQDPDSISSSTKLNGSRTKKYVKASSGDPCTTDLSEFGNRELSELRDLIDEMLSSGLPDDFYDDQVVPTFNKNSGMVFLTNSDYQTAAINPMTGKLESWYCTPYSGYEGFLSDLVDQYQDDPESWDEEDIEYLRDLGADI